MFELSRIGELSNTDYIDHICQKIGQNDLLAWNSERDTGLERRTLTQFADCLCKRANAYQSTYGMAAAQNSGGAAPKLNLSGGGGSHSKPHHHGRSHKVTTRSRGGPPPSSRPSNKPFCFKCEGSYRLEDCNEFKKETVECWKSFAVRLNLFFMCFILKHSTRNCYKKKTCGIDGCTLLHHPLFHLTTNASTDTVRANTGKKTRQRCGQTSHHQLYQGAHTGQSALRQRQ